MIDGIFRISIPVSYPVLMITIFVIAIFSILFLSTLSTVFLLILVQGGILRLKPITDLLDSICNYVLPELKETIIANTKASFPVIVKGTLPRKGIYLFHPHGVITTTHMVNIGINPVSNWPVKNIRGTAMYSLWYSFGVREIFDGSFVPSHYSDMKNVLDEDMSLSVSLGGIEEMRYIFKDKIRVKLKSRRGVFRLAIETGTPLVPVLVYGENEVCDNLGNWRGFDWINRLLRKFNLTLLIPSWELYTKFFALAYKPLDVPVVSVIGEPVAVGPAREPTDEDIRLVRAIYIQRLRKLYRDTRPASYAEELEVV
jgi:hypothetical protein